MSKDNKKYCPRCGEQIARRQMCGKCGKINILNCSKCRKRTEYCEHCNTILV